MNRLSISLIACLYLLLNHTVIADEITIASWNVEWFFDSDTADVQSDLGKKNSAPDDEQWNWKLQAVAKVIANMKPTVLALQEVENRKVLRELTNLLKLSLIHI